MFKMNYLYITTTTGEPNNVVLSHTEQAIKAGFIPFFIFPRRASINQYKEFYHKNKYEYYEINIEFDNSNYFKYIKSLNIS